MSLWKFLREVVREFQADSCFRLGAALAYYTVFGLAPTLIIIMRLTGIFLGDEAVQNEIYLQIRGLVGAESARQIQTMVLATSAHESATLASVISAATLLFAASGAFYTMKDALNIIWKVKAVPRNGIVKYALDRLWSFAIVLAIGFIFLVALVVNALVSQFAGFLGNVLPGAVRYVLVVVNLSVSVLVTTLFFAIIFKTLPDVKNRWSDVWIGALFTALLFALGRWAIGFYIGTAGVGSTYGAAGAIVVILVWVYYAAQILFLGAEFTYVYARHRSSAIQPSANAVRVITREVLIDENTPDKPP